MINSFILSSKIIPDINLFHKVVKSIVPEFSGFNIEDGVVTVELNVAVTQVLIDQIEAIVPPNATNMSMIQKIVSEAILEGQRLIMEFAAENVAMGITQDGMTSVVRKNLEQVTLALMTGSLYDAITEIRLIPNDQKDLKYITDARLLQFINKIETYLKIPLSSTL